MMIKNATEGANMFQPSPNGIITWGVVLFALYFDEEYAITELHDGVDQCFMTQTLCWINPTPPINSLQLPILFINIMMIPHVVYFV